MSQSSESDDENYTRHDRFKSERFNENNKGSGHPKPREEKQTRSDKYYDSRRHKDQSPRAQKRPEITSSSSSYRWESSSNRDWKDRGSRSKYSKITYPDKLTSKIGHSEETVKGQEDSCRKRPNKLSSLLENFDKQLESKRKALENTCEIGPSLPTQVKKANNSDNSVNITKEIGPSLPPIIPENSKETTVDHSGNMVNGEITNVTVVLEDNVKKEESVGLDIVIENPVLPPHFQHEVKLKKDCSFQDPSNSKSVPQSTDRTESTTLQSTPTISTQNLKDSTEADSFGPSLPQKAESEIYGPVLPPKVEPDSYGPALPPSFKKEHIQGPTLPSGVSVDDLETLAEESEDEDMVGPLPEGKMNLTQYQLDLRAMHIKQKLEEEKSGSSKEIKKREEWMLELPAGKAKNLGLGPRSFRMREAPDMSDRSSWTDTPADKLRKQQQTSEGEVESVNSEEMVRKAFIKERDEAMDNISQVNEDEERPKSLLELHQKKLKKKKKKDEKEGKKIERRPFDRNVDLQVNRFDEAQKKAIYKKAQLLDTRFSTGESKYL